MAFVLIVVLTLFMVVVFIYFFQMFSSFCVQICGLVSGVRFTTFLPSVVQSTAHLPWISVMLQAMDC